MRRLSLLDPAGVFVFGDSGVPRLAAATTLSSLPSRSIAVFPMARSGRIVKVKVSVLCIKTVLSGLIISSGS